MKRSIFAVLMVLYLLVWGLQKGKAEWADFYLSPAPPAPVLKVASGYARQLAAFSLFVKVAIFAGGTLRGVEKTSYADSMAQNFDVMTDLYPEFIDSYHYCQAFLAPISPEYAQRTNVILERGIATNPDIFYLPFFQGFNYFFYMDQPVKAAEIFYSMSKRPHAPPIFGRLASTLMGRGGNLLAGRTMLLAILSTEKNEQVKKRYRRNIENFNKALEVQAALDRYRNEHGKDADALQELVPHYLEALPLLHDNNKLVWAPPLLRLEQPNFPVHKKGLGNLNPKKGS
jgi:hypothetical protein